MPHLLILLQIEKFVASGKIFVIDNTGGETSGTAQATSMLILVESGPLLFRTVNGSTKILPPLNSVLLYAIANMNVVDKTQMITYRIEDNTSDLPSFTLEQSLSKDPTVLTTNAGHSSVTEQLKMQMKESQSFTRLARGNRVNSLTLEAAEGEVKFNVDINSRLVDSITDIYHKAGVAPTFEARNGITVNENLFNWNAGTNSGAPFFFSSGSLEAFGQQIP